MACWHLYQQTLTVYLTFAQFDQPISELMALLLHILLRNNTLLCFLATSGLSYVSISKC